MCEMRCTPDLEEMIPDKIETYNLRGVPEATFSETFIRDSEFDKAYKIYFT